MLRPVADARRHIGTINTIANGNFQLAYCAANTRKYKDRRGGDNRDRRYALLLLLVSKVRPFKGDAGRQHLLGTSRHTLHRGARRNTLRDGAHYLGGGIEAVARRAA
jgi:hypothetical protein